MKNTYISKLKEIQQELSNALDVLDTCRDDALKQIDECPYFKHKLTWIDRLLGATKPEVEYRKDIIKNFYAQNKQDLLKNTFLQIQVVRDWRNSKRKK